MWGLAESIKDTRVYQEAFEEGFKQGFQEGRLMALHLLLKLGLTPQQIAEELDLDIATIAKYLEDHHQSD